MSDSGRGLERERVAGRAGLLASAWTCLLLLLCPNGAWAADPDWIAGRLSPLRRVEGALRAGEWDRAFDLAEEEIVRMAGLDLRGRKSRATYGLAFAFRALAAEGLGRRHQADWDWGCARALDAEVVGMDFSSLGPAQQRILEREAARGGLPPRVEDLIATHGDVRAEAPLKLRAPMRGYPPLWTRNHRQGTVECAVRIGVDGLPLDPRPKVEDDLSEETSIFVWVLLALADWRFEPARLNGSPVESVWGITVNFVSG